MESVNSVKKDVVCVLVIKVVPSSGRQSIGVDKSGMIKAYLKSQPERGAANNELITLLAHLLKVPSAHVSLLTGATARTKRVRIVHLDELSVRQRLGIEVQHALV